MKLIKIVCWQKLCGAPRHIRILNPLLSSTWIKWRVAEDTFFLKFVPLLKWNTFTCANDLALIESRLLKWYNLCSWLIDQKQAKETINLSKKNHCAIAINNISLSLSSVPTHNARFLAEHTSIFKYFIDGIEFFSSSDWKRCIT